MDYSRIIGEAPMDMVKPSEMVSRLDLVVLELAAAGIVFQRLPRGFLENREFIELKGGGTEVGVGQHPLAAPGPPGTARWVLPTLASVSDTSFFPRLSSGPKKIHKKFHCVWTPFDMYFL
jgi:hypothetical protein